VPLRRLTDAAQRFSLSIDPEAIPVTGPREVRAALETFNLMQQRVRDGFRERTHILAAIAHDLQTPITRLRLRLEQVKDGPARKAGRRSGRDAGAGARWPRSGPQRRDAGGMVAGRLDSLVASLVEDHAEMGEPVFLAGIAACRPGSSRMPWPASGKSGQQCGQIWRHGAGILPHGGQVEISVADSGPGIAPERIEDMFEPFVRGDTSRSRATGGTGIGLTIARAQARSFGATLTLANRAAADWWRR
jgi:signal transduction histidine kinase